MFLDCGNSFLILISLFLLLLFSMILIAIPQAGRDSLATAAAACAEVLLKFLGTALVPTMVFIARTKLTITLSVLSAFFMISSRSSLSVLLQKLLNLFANCN